MCHSIQTARRVGSNFEFRLCHALRFAVGASVSNVLVHAVTEEKKSQVMINCSESPNLVPSIRKTQLEKGSDCFHNAAKWA